MIPVYVYLTLISLVAHSEKEEVFMAITLLYQEQCPQFEGESTCNGTVNVFAVPVPHYPGLNISKHPKTTIPPDVHGTTGTECCGYCDCEIDCVKYGSCCPQMYDSFAAGKAAVDTTRFACVKPQFITDKNKTNYIAAHGHDDTWIVAKCKPEVARYLDKKTVSQCWRPLSSSTVRSLVPVSDGSLHYRNKFCALCNGKEFSQLTNWKIEVTCPDFINIQIDSEDFLQTVEEKRCNVFYWPPATIPTKRCNIPTYSISKCNMTGYWQEYNETIDSACEAFLDPFNLTYKNYFCYLCNKYEDHELKYCQARKDITGVTPPFTALLDIGEVEAEERDELPKCDTLNQFWDYKRMICRDLHCQELRYLRGLECLIKQNQIINKCYQMFVKLNVSEGQLVAVLFRGVTNMATVGHRLINLLPSDSTTVRKFQIYEKTVDRDNMLYIEYVVVELSVEVRSTPGMDTEIKINKNLNGNSFTVNDVTYVTELDFYVTEHVTHAETSEPVEMLRVPQADISVSKLLPLMYSKALQGDGVDGNVCSESTILPFSKMQFCPYIDIDLDEWDIEIENGFLTIEKELTAASFTKWEYEISEDILHICLDDFHSIYAALPSLITLKPQTDDTIGPKRILAFVCIIISLVSLLVTVVVYLLFSKLQSQPGINNVILCTCLFCAQALYQFGAGQTSLSYWECSVIGAFCHFFWLSVMFSMNSCSVQMFLIFKSSVKLTPKFGLKHTLKYVSYVLLASLVGVVVNVTVSVIKSDGNKSGYGGNICYISSYSMNLVTFIVPTGCTVIANLVLFAYVVFKIEKSNVSSTKMNLERNYFGVYARLSTLTGLTWIFGFMLLFVESDVLEYLFIIFNASQGLMIMLAFIFNQRVFSLCCQEKSFIRTSLVIISSKKSRSLGSTVNRSSGNMSGVSEAEPQPSTSCEYYNGSLTL